MKRILTVGIFIWGMTIVVFPQIPADRNTLLNADEGTQTAVADNVGYPSPKRVLDLSATLNLTESQRKSVREIYNEMYTRARELGKRIIKIEEELDEAFKAGFVTTQSVNDDTEQIGKLRGKLRGVYLGARIDTKRVLTANQMDMYKKLSVPPTKK